MLLHQSSFEMGVSKVPFLLHPMRRCQTFIGSRIPRSLLRGETDGCAAPVGASSSNKNARFRPANTAPLGAWIDGADVFILPLKITPRWIQEEDLPVLESLREDL